MPGRRPLYRLPRPHVRRVEAALSAQAARHAELPAGDAACARWRDRRDRAHVYDLAEGARAGRGPGHPVHPGEGRLYANLDYLEDATRQLYKVYSTVPEKDTCSPSTAWATCTRVFPASCSSLGASGRGPEEVLTGSRAAHRVLPRPRHCLLAAGAPRLGRRTAVQFVITTTRDARELADVLADVEKSARESGMFIFSDSDLPSRRRRSSFTSTTTRRTGSASRWPISAARWRRCSAAITSICSTFTGAAIA